MKSVLVIIVVILSLYSSVSLFIILKRPEINYFKSQMTQKMICCIKFYILGKSLCHNRGFTTSADKILDRHNLVNKIQLQRL